MFHDLRLPWPCLISSCYLVFSLRRQINEVFITCSFRVVGAWKDWKDWKDVKSEKCENAKHYLVPLQHHFLFFYSSGHIIVITRLNPNETNSSCAKMSIFSGCRRLFVLQKSETVRYIIYYHWFYGGHVMSPMVSIVSPMGLARSSPGWRWASGQMDSVPWWMRWCGGQILQLAGDIWIHGERGNMWGIICIYRYLNIYIYYVILCMYLLF